MEKNPSFYSGTQKFLEKSFESFIHLNIAHRCVLCLTFAVVFEIIKIVKVLQW